MVQSCAFVRLLSDLQVLVKDRGSWALVVDRRTGPETDRPSTWHPFVGDQNSLGASWCGIPTINGTYIAPLDTII